MQLPYAARQYYTFCCSGYHPLAMEFVDRYRLEIDHADNFGQRPIHLATRSENLHLVRFLHSRGANMEGVLDLAEAHHHVSIVHYLTNARAGARAEIGRYIVEMCNSSRFNERCSCYSISENEDVVEE